jgi:hypothetical protein
VDQVHDLQREGDGPSVSDPIACPECQGTRSTRIGTLEMRCEFCNGRGVVGGPDEDAPRYNARGWKIPEEGEEYDPEVHGPLPPASDHPAVRESGLCTMCLGARVVVATGTYVEAPCPVCQPR